MNFGPRLFVIRLLALFILESASVASAEDSAKARPFGVVFEPSALFGVSHWRKRDWYLSGDPVFGGDDKWNGAHLSPAGELGIMLGARLGDHVQLGGYGRLGVAGAPDRDHGSRRGIFATLGGQLTLSHHAHEGLYGVVRYGAAIADEANGWSVGGGLGYGLPGIGNWHFGVGIETSYAQMDWQYQGDWGHSELDSRWITTGLAVRLRYRDS